MFGSLAARRWLVAVALVVGLPLGALCQPPYLRAWTLLALECDWVLTSLWLAYRGVPSRVSEPAWALVWLMLGLGDILYNAWAADVPRYPAHYLPDGLFFAVAFLLVVLVRRLRNAKLGSWADEFSVLLASLVALAVEFIVVLSLAQSEPRPLIAVILSWTYAATTAWLSGELLLLTLKTTSWASFGRGLGLMLMLVGDLAQRNEAVVPDGPRQAGEAEVAWVMGMGLACLAQVASGFGQTRRAMSPWASARVAIGLLGPLSSAAVILGAFAWGLLQLSAARDWAQVLGLAWLGWAASNAVALGICRALGDFMPEPDAPAEHWLQRLATPSLPLGEFKRWRQEHQRIAEQLVVALKAHRESKDGTRALGLAQQLAHDLGGPLKVLEGALMQLTTGEDASLPTSANARQSARRKGALLARRAAARLMLLSREARQQELPIRVQNTQKVGSVSLYALCRLAWQEAQQRHEQSNIGWHFKKPKVSDGWDVIAPVSSVMRALNNVLDNAAFAVEHFQGDIRLSLVRTTDALVVAIDDDGEGLCAEQKANFGKGPLPSKRGPGHGLGIWSASEALRASGGTLAFENREPKGLRVTLGLMRGERVPWVLVDDDALVCELWQLRAKEVGADLCVIDRVLDQESFVKKTIGLPRCAPVFVDRNLHDNVSGDEVMRWCEELGFLTVQCISGGDNSMGKAPPF